MREMDDHTDDENGWSEYGLRGDVNYISTHWQRWQKYDASLFDAMIVCAVCGFTNFCTYDPVSDSHDFSSLFVDVEVVDESDLMREKSAPHMKPYIHKTHLGKRCYECSVCTACAANLQNRKEHIIPYRSSYIVAIVSAPLQFMQALSIVNIHLNLTRRLVGFYHGMISVRQRAANPSLSDEELLSHVIKHKIQHTLPGSLAWHKKHL